MHLDQHIIDQYLAEIFRVSKDHTQIVIQYSDKTKEAALNNKGFSQNDPLTMKKMINKHGFIILEENQTILHHSCIIRFQKNYIQDDNRNYLPMQYAHNAHDAVP